MPRSFILVLVLIALSACDRTQADQKRAAADQLAEAMVEQKFVREPTQAEIDQVRPKDAPGRYGTAGWTCTVQADGSLTQCEAVSEPSGGLQGFSQAARSLLQIYRVAPTDAHGPTAGRRVRLDPVFRFDPALVPDFAPRGTWRRVGAGQLWSIRAPADTLYIAQQGTDSFVGAFQHANFSLTFDDGAYTGDIGNLADQGYRVESLTVDGYPAKLATRAQRPDPAKPSEECSGQAQIRIEWSNEARTKSALLLRGCAFRAQDLPALVEILKSVERGG